MRYQNVVYAAITTSKARIKLLNAMNAVRRIGRLLYADTDSIVAEFKSKVEVIENIKYNFTKEDTELKDATFVMPKTYALILSNNKEIIRAKGFSQNSANLTYQKVADAFYQDKEIEISNTTRIYKSNYQIQTITKTFFLNTSEYDKRIFINHKKDTIPRDVQN